MKVGFLLILIYFPFSLDPEPRASLRECLAEAPARIGEQFEYVDEAGAKRNRRVVTAFCAQGVVDTRRR